jgi:hypothetical protein
MRNGEWARVTSACERELSRFFCPPPCVNLFGDGWQRKREQIKQLSANKSVKVYIRFLDTGYIIKVCLQTHRD